MSLPRPELELCLERTVPFHDVDPMGLVWHGHYLKYLDEARMALFDRSGLDLYNLVGMDGCGRQWERPECAGALCPVQTHYGYDQFTKYPGADFDGVQ